MSKLKNPRFKIELIGGPLDGNQYMAKELPETLEIHDLIRLDPSSAEIPGSRQLSFYQREMFKTDQWLYLFKSSQSV